MEHLTFKASRMVLRHLCMRVYVCDENDHVDNAEPATLDDLIEIVRQLGHDDAKRFWANMKKKPEEAPRPVLEALNKEREDHDLHRRAMCEALGVDDDTTWRDLILRAADCLNRAYQ